MLSNTSNSDIPLRDVNGQERDEEAIPIICLNNCGDGTKNLHRSFEFFLRGSDSPLTKKLNINYILNGQNQRKTSIINYTCLLCR